MRSENATNRPGISGSVGVAADSAKHGADVEAGTATNAMQHLTLLNVREQFAPAIVEENDVKFLGAIDLVRFARAANQCVVASDWLAGARRCQHGPKQCEVLQPRNHLFDAGECDM